MRLLRGDINTFWVLALTGVMLLLSTGPVSAGPKKDRFSVIGWVASKLSPKRNARSTGQAQRLRPMPVDLNQPAAGTSYAGMAAAANPAVYPANPPQQPRNARPPSPIGNAPGSRPPVPAPAPAPVSIGNGRPPLPPPASDPRRQRRRSSPSHFTGERSVAELRRRAEYLAKKGLPYKFGGDHPSEGGMDCSGTMQFLLKSIGYSDMPRTSYHQYSWLKEKGTLRQVGFFHSAERAARKFRPGDLIFWGGTYDSGYKVSHVMIYLGQGRTGKHYVFGARGKKVKGLNGSGVDVFEFHLHSTGGRLIGYGRPPGLKG